MRLSIFSNLKHAVAARLPVVRSELAHFWTFLTVLILGAVFYGAIYINILDRQARAEVLQQQLKGIQAEQRALETDIAELSRLNRALLPSTQAGQGLDWETLKYLSFARFDMIDAGEVIIHFKETDQ